MINRSSISGGLILGALCAFTYGGSMVYRARKDLSLASREVTATAQVRVNFDDPMKPKSRRRDGPDCTYYFQIGESIHHGRGWCSSDLIVQGALDSLKFSSDVHPEPVYYDPADPETNSLIEYRQRSELDGKGASLFFLFGAVISVLAILAFALGSMQTNATARIDPAPPEEPQSSRTEFMNNLDQLLEKDRKDGRL
jgi:hypothetical protein